MFSPKTNFLNISKQINFQSVRYRLRHKSKEPFRKPIWQPIAPSKLYRIGKKEELSEQEIQQRKHLEYTYDINMKSIKNFLKSEFYLPTLNSKQDDVTAGLLANKNELQVALEENSQENKRIAQMREERLKTFKKDLEAKLIMMKIKKEEDDRRIGEEYDRLVCKEIERSKTYITKDNLDEKIEEALTHRTDYDYAIDVNGRIIFDGSLHPYAFRPKAIPETSSNTEEYQNLDASKPIYLRAKKLF